MSTEFKSMGEIFPINVCVFCMSGEGNIFLYDSQEFFSWKEAMEYVNFITSNPAYLVKIVIS